MSDSYGMTHPDGPDGQSPPPSGMADTAKSEAADLKDTATVEAKNVLGTAKEEASAVVGEAKMQAKELYAQTQQELHSQARTQQQRLAMGLRSVGDELGAMAANSDSGGVATDLVQQVSGRLSAAATWLGDRDPGSVLTEVKRFARRQPGTFILAAAVTGIVVGRLTRALAANASDEKSDATTPALPPVNAPASMEPDPGEVTPVGTAPDRGAGAPLSARAASVQPDILGEDGDDRPHTV
jgi:hypothetical protein